MFPLTHALQLDHPVPSFVWYVACIFVWLGLWLMLLLKCQVGFVKGCGTFGVPALQAHLLLREQTLLPLPLVGRGLQAHQLATACPQQEPKAFPNNLFILPVPCILQRFGKVLHKMESQFNNKLNIFVNLPMLIMVFLAWLKPRAAFLCGVAAAKA